MWRASAFIPCGAPASVADETEFTTGTSMQAILQSSFPELGRVSVSRYAAEEPSKKGHTYLVTFQDYPGDLPLLRMDATNATGLVIVTDVDEVRKGSPGRWYAYDEALDEEPDLRAGFSSKLFPCWVMLFDSTVLKDDEDIPGRMEDAISMASFSILVDNVDAYETSVDVDPRRFRGGNGPLSDIVALRVQVADTAPGAVLSLAEVQVFANRSHTIDSFTGGGVVAARPWTAPYQASVSMSSNFVETLVAGRWLLTVKDTSKHKWYREQTIQTAVGETQMPSQDRSGVPNDVEASGPGQLADWVSLHQCITWTSLLV
jgi:hypothetical protein